MAQNAAAPRTRTVAQNNAIWGLMSRLGKASGLARDELDPMLRAACRAASGQEHTSRLTPTQAAVVIEQLHRELATYDRPAARQKPEPALHHPWGIRQTGPRKVIPITAFQSQVILGLFSIVGMVTIEARTKFCQRQVKKSWPTTQAEADALIEPLSAMALRHVDGEDFRRRVLALRHNRRLDAWKTGFVDDVTGKLEGHPNPKAVVTPFRLAKLLECEAAVANGAA